MLWFEENIAETLKGNQMCASVRERTIKWIQKSKRQLCDVKSISSGSNHQNIGEDLSRTKVRMLLTLATAINRNILYQADNAT